MSKPFTQIQQLPCEDRWGMSFFGLTSYESMWERMRYFNAHRHDNTQDQIWITEHYPVYTLGLAGRHEHLHLAASSPIPVIASDRGGQVTYHGPGQVMVYTLINLNARKLGVREYVALLEQSVINVLAHAHVVGERIIGKPGVYVEGRKISALGLRVKRGACYHGLAFNVDMDLFPFQHIDPCGYSGMPVTDLAHEIKHRTSTPPMQTQSPAYWGELIAQDIKSSLYVS